jgi:hypothetical protein
MPELSGLILRISVVQWAFPGKVAPMVRISAAEAISPAINRTRQFLFAPPFRWGTFLKLCLVGAITEGLGTNFRSFGGRGGQGHPSHLPQGSTIFHFTPEMIAAIVAMSLLLIFVGLVVAYLITRLRFAYFHCLVTNTRAITPGWRLYREQANRFFRMNIAVGVCLMLMVGLMVAPFVPGFVRLYRQMQAGSGPDAGLLLSLILPLIPIILMFVVVAILLDIVLRDWMMPHYALEDATAGQAWSAVWENISGEKGSFFVYTLLRLVLPIIAAIGLFIVLLFPGAVMIGAVAMTEWAIHTGFAHASGLSFVIGVLLEVFIGLLALGFAIVIGVSLGGPISTAIREYALMFYGGRFQKLGDILFPPMPNVPARTPAV